MEVDSNHRSKLQQIYSLSPLATREPAHTGFNKQSYLITAWIKNQDVFSNTFFIFQTFLLFYYSALFFSSDPVPASSTPATSKMLL